MSEKKPNSAVHYEKDYLSGDELLELKQTLGKALNLSDDDFKKLSPEVKNLLSGRRRLGVNWLDDYEVVAEVIEDKGCNCGIKKGQIAVFDMRHRLKVEKSDMKCCMNILSPVLAIFYMSFDRASEGLDRVSRVWNHFDCLVTNDSLAKEKAIVKVYLRDAKSQKIITQPVLDRIE